MRAIDEWPADHRPSGRRLSDERGVVSSMVAVLGFAIFVSLALVVDGGRQLGALTEAQNIADNAARYGSQEVNEIGWRDGGAPVVDEARAIQRVDTYLGTVPPEVQIVDRVVVVVGDTVTVTVTVARNEFFFGARNAVATESASALDGVVDP